MSGKSADRRVLITGGYVAQTVFSYIKYLSLALDNKFSIIESREECLYDEASLEQNIKSGSKTSNHLLLTSLMASKKPKETGDTKWPMVQNDRCLT